MAAEAVAEVAAVPAGGCAFGAHEGAAARTTQTAATIRATDDAATFAGGALISGTGGTTLFARA
jgi:hypothetical protein